MMTDCKNRRKNFLSETRAVLNCKEKREKGREISRKYNLLNKHQTVSSARSSS